MCDEDGQGRKAPAREGDHHEEAEQIRTRSAPQRQRPRESWHREANSIRRTRAAREAGNGRHREKGRRQNREGRTATAAGGVSFRPRETGLPLLRQRRSRAVVHQAPRRSLPRLFQTALRFRGTKREHNSNPQSSNGQVILLRGREELVKVTFDPVGPVLNYKGMTM